MPLSLPNTYYLHKITIARGDIVNKDILNISNLRKIYHTKTDEILAVDDFSLNLSKGEIVAIVGPSGCGKSTILNMIGNLIPKSYGEIQFNEEKNISYMLQEDALFPFRTVFKNCLLGLEIKNIDSVENRKYVNDLLKKYGLEDFKNSYPNNLSGGMRQRVALVRTLATHPNLILLDEPFSALDFQSRLMLTDDVYKIIKEENISAIMITHNIEEAVSMADRIIVLSDRPSIIKKIYSTNFNELPSINRKDERFNDLCTKIWKEIDAHV